MFAILEQVEGLRPSVRDLGHDLSPEQAVAAMELLARHSLFYEMATNAKAVLIKSTNGLVSQTIYRIEKNNGGPPLTFRLIRSINYPSEGIKRNGAKLALLPMQEEER